MKINKKGELVKKSSKTYHDGANEERSCILAKVRRMIKSLPPTTTKINVPQSLLHFEAWLLDRDRRYKKKVGGL